MNDRGNEDTQKYTYRYTRASRVTYRGVQLALDRATSLSLHLWLLFLNITQQSADSGGNRICKRRQGWHHYVTWWCSDRSDRIFNCLKCYWNLTGWCKCASLMPSSLMLQIKHTFLHASLFADFIALTEIKEVDVAFLLEKKDHFRRACNLYSYVNPVGGWHQLLALNLLKNKLF